MSTVDGGWRGPNIVKDGLVLYLDAGSPNSYYGGTGTVWKDMSGNGNNGTLTNGPTFNSANGGSIVFDGVDDYVNCGTSTSLNEPKTIEVWLYVTSQKTGMILSRGIANYEVYTFTDGFVYTYWGNRFNTTINNPPITLNLWNQFCFTISGVTETVYKNGDLIGPRTLNATPSYTNTGDVNIGRRNNGSQYLNGRVSIIKLYNRELSSTEVLQNFNATRARFGI
jgi:hypothetical protein